MTAIAPPRLSLVEGPPLATQPGLGALTLPGWIETLCDRYARREAIVWYDAEDRRHGWSYAELYAAARQVARALIATGHGRGAHVGVLMSNRPEWLAASFGALLAGCVAVPFSTFSSAGELAELLARSSVGTLLFEARVLAKDFAAMLTALDPAIATASPGALACARFPFLRRLVALDAAAGAIEPWDGFLAGGAAIADALVHARGVAITASDPAMLYFSSGSTGVPKGILNSQRGIAVQMWRWPVQMGLPADGSVIGWGANGFFWSGGFAQAVGTVLTCGGTLVLQPTFDPAEALRLIEREKINYLTCWPHQYARMAEAPNFAATDLASLHYIGRGTPFDARVSTDWTEPLASYGSTETFTFNCGFAHDVTEAERAGSHGRPFAGHALKIVDPLSGAIVPRGESGEIAVKGVCLMIGYLGMTQEQCLDAEGFFRTGDGGRIDAEGRLFFEGRLNDIIKTGGANVSPVEIDAALQAIAGVRLSQTVGIPDAMLGEMVVSCVVPLAGHRLDEPGLRAALKARLASYKVPRRIVFVAADELSLTGSAKVRTAALRRLAARLLSAAP